MVYTPSQLLLWFNPTQQIAWDLNPESEAQLGELEAYVRGIAESSHPLPASDPELRVATLDEICQTALNRLFQANKSLLRREMRRRRLKEPKEGDLVLLRRFATDLYHGRKLEPRWEGPYWLADVAFHGRSGRLLDLYSGKVVRVRASGVERALPS